MLGAIIGDICGSTYEFEPANGYDFELFNEDSTFTDDTILSLAVVDAMINNLDLAQTLANYAHKYPMKGYGGMFFDWIFSDDLKPYNSYGNGSAMRVSAVGFLARSEEEVMELAKWSAMSTHNHPEGIKGAQAVALAIYLAKTGSSKNDIKEAIETKFKYNLSRTLKEIEPNYYFDVTCQGSVPEAIICFLESNDFESAIRNAIWLKGDADTQACMAGAIAQAYYGGIPIELKNLVYNLLPDHLLDTLHQFHIYQSYEMEVKERTIQHQDIQKILEFIPYFENTKEFTYCKIPEWKQDVCDQLGIKNTPIIYEDKGLIDFCKTIVETKFCVVFDWFDWQAGREIFMKKERIDKADLLTLRMLITAIWRNDRFCDGALVACAENGDILRILRRLEKLIDDNKSSINYQ